VSENQVRSASGWTRGAAAVAVEPVPVAAARVSRRRRAKVTVAEDTPPAVEVDEVVEVDIFGLGPDAL